MLDECLGDQAGARRLRDEADRLADRIETLLWWEEEGTYYLGLDGDKRPIRSVASNAGHLLWAGAVTPERAARVVRRLLAEDMWSGWGVRTLSARHPAYNPFSYQRGSIWPHDNGILAMGFRRYGHVEQVWTIAQALLAAAACFQFGRLPELFAGLDRDRGAFPVQYPEANAPQAWASGSVPHLLHALLGLDPDAGARRLAIRPALPPWLGRIELRGLRVGAEKVRVVAAREGVEARSDGDLQIAVGD